MNLCNANYQISVDVVKLFKKQAGTILRLALSIDEILLMERFTRFCRHHVGPGLVCGQPAVSAVCTAGCRTDQVDIIRNN